MKVALISTGGQDKRSYGTALGLGYLKVFGERHDFIEIEIVNDLDEILAYQPDLVGVSAVTSCYEYAIELAENIKKNLNVPVIIGGYHITSMPESLHDIFDLGVLGEGELTFEEILLKLEENRDIENIDLSKIEGIVFKDKSTSSIMITPERKMIEKLDVLPFPYRTVNSNNPDEAVIFTSRGCPYQCIFCSSAQHWRRTFRSFSAEKVVAEIENILILFPNTTSIYILDDLFIADKVRFKRMVELIEEKGLNRKLEFKGFVRANLVDDEICTFFKRMNFIELRFGAETGSPRLLHELKVGSVTCQDNQRVVDLCEKYDIACSASMIVGVPGETEEDLMLSHQFLMKNKNKLFVSGFYLFQAFPGTPVWREISKKYPILGEWKSFNLSFHNEDFDINLNNYYNDEIISKEDFLNIIHGYFSEYLPIKAFAHKSDKYLEIGVGNSPRKGFTHCDVRALPHVEYVCNANHLTIEDNRFEMVYSRHMLEHLDEVEGLLALLEMNRVLIPNGVLHLIVPNIGFHIEQYKSNPEHAFAAFWGWQDHSHDIHKWGYTSETLAIVLSICGFVDIQDLTDSLYSYEKDVMHLEFRCRKNSSELLKESLQKKFTLVQTQRILTRIMQMLKEELIDWKRIRIIYANLRDAFVESEIKILFDVKLGYDISPNTKLQENELLKISRNLTADFISEFHLLIKTFQDKSKHSIKLQYLIGSLYEGMNNYARALEEFKKIEELTIVKTFEQEVGIQFHIGFNCYQLNLLQDAKGYLKKCIRLEPGHVKAKQILNSLYEER